MSTLAPPTPDAARLSRRTALAAVSLALLSAAYPAHAEDLTDLARIQANGVLKVAVYKDNPPYSHGSQDNMQGLDVSLAAALAKELGVKLALLPFDAGERMNDDLRNMVWKGHYLGYGPADVMLHVPVDKYLIDENPQALIFAPYVRESLVVFYNPKVMSAVRSPEELKGQKLAAERGSGAASVLATYQGGLLREQIRIFDLGTQAAESVIKGERDAAYVSRAQAEAAIFATQANPADWGIAPMYLPGIATNGWPIGLAVKQANKNLAEAIEAALKRLRESGEMLAMFKAHGLTLAAP